MQINNLTRRLPRWLIVLFVIAGVVSVLITILKVLTPTQSPLPATSITTSNIGDTPTTLSGITYTGAAPEFPTAMPIVQASPTSLSTDWLNRILEKYQLEPVTTQATVWKSPDYTLVMNQQIGQYTLATNDLSSVTGTFEKGKALTSAQNIISELFPDVSLVVIPTSEKILASYEGNQSATDVGTLYFAHFSYSINGFPFVYNNTDLPILTITLTPEYQLASLSFFPQFISYSAIENRSLISMETALSNINQGKVGIAEIFEENLEQVDLSDITSGTMTNVSLVYKLDEELSLAYPFYVFEGTGTTAQAKNVVLTLTTPAVATQALP